MTNLEAEIDHEVWSTESDYDHVKKIMERATLNSPMGCFDRGKPPGAKPPGGVTGWEAVTKDEKIAAISKEKDRF